MLKKDTEMRVVAGLVRQEMNQIYDPVREDYRVDFVQQPHSIQKDQNLGPIASEYPKARRQPPPKIAMTSFPRSSGTYLKPSQICAANSLQATYALITSQHASFYVINYE